MITTVCGVAINNITTYQALGMIDQFVQQRKNSIVVTPNVDHIVKLQNDAEFMRIYRDASLVLADGMPLLWASRILGNPIVEKISGSDIFWNICELASQKQYGLFLLGGRPGAASGAAQTLQGKYPGIRITGTYCPPFGFEYDPAENSKIIAMIRAAKPDILFVGLGAPKQEKWIYNHRKELNVPVSMGIGVTFEFACGMVKRAPLWMQRSGLEWMWRLLMEPGRLWKRYLVEDMKFFILVLRQKFQNIRGIRGKE